MRRGLLLACGWALLALGAVGAFVPVLPTTPFVLLAAACFSSSSRKMHNWLCKSRLFGPYIDGYRSGRGIPPAAKARAILLMWLCLGLSAFAVQRPWVVAVLAATGIGVTVFLLRFKGKRAHNTPET